MSRNLRGISVMSEEASWSSDRSGYDSLEVREMAAKVVILASEEVVVDAICCDVHDDENVISDGGPCSAVDNNVFEIRRQQVMKEQNQIRRKILASKVGSNDDPPIIERQQIDAPELQSQEGATSDLPTEVAILEQEVAAAFPCDTESIESLSQALPIVVANLVSESRSMLPEVVEKLEQRLQKITDMLAGLQKQYDSFSHQSTVGTDPLSLTSSEGYASDQPSPSTSRTLIRSPPRRARSMDPPCSSSEAKPRGMDPPPCRRVLEEEEEEHDEEEDRKPATRPDPPAKTQILVFGELQDRPPIEPSEPNSLGDHVLPDPRPQQRAWNPAELDRKLPAEPPPVSLPPYQRAHHRTLHVARQHSHRACAGLMLLTPERARGAAPWPMPQTQQAHSHELEADAGSLDKKPPARATWPPEVSETKDEDIVSRKAIEAKKMASSYDEGKQQAKMEENDENDSDQLPAQHDDDDDDDATIQKSLQETEQKIESHHQRLSEGLDGVRERRERAQRILEQRESVTSIDEDSIARQRRYRVLRGPATPGAFAVPGLDGNQDDEDSVEYDTGTAQDEPSILPSATPIEGHLAEDGASPSVLRRINQLEGQFVDAVDVQRAEPANAPLVVKVSCCVIS